VFELFFSDDYVAYPGNGSGQNQKVSQYASGKQLLAFKKRLNDNNQGAYKRNYQSKQFPGSDFFF